MKSIIYWHPAIYTLIMKFLYKENFYDRYRIIVDHIPRGADVIDVCCGDCYIYLHFLKEKNVNYLGLDINKIFVNAAKRKGVRADQFDLAKDQLPQVDYILMQASMYHFIPYEDRIMQKILNSASKRAIIAEPAINISSSENFFIRNMSRILTGTGTDHSNERFDKKRLLDFFNKHKATGIFEIEGGRDIIGVFDRR